MRYGWSLEGSDWLLASQALASAGMSWKRTTLAELYQESVPRSSGVYIICASTHNLPNLFGPLYNAIYVGQAKASLQQRFLQHCRSPKPRLEAAKLIFRSGLDYWYTAAPASEVDTLERSLIRCLGPSVNMLTGIQARVGAPRPAGG